MDFSCKQTSLHSHWHTLRFCPCGCFQHWGLASGVDSISFLMKHLQSLFNSGVAHIQNWKWTGALPEVRNSTGEPLREDVNRNVQIDLWGATAVRFVQPPPGVDITEGGRLIWHLVNKPSSSCLHSDGRGSIQSCRDLDWQQASLHSGIWPIKHSRRSQSSSFMWRPALFGGREGIEPTTVLFFCFFSYGNPFLSACPLSWTASQLCYSWKWISLISAKSHAM